MLAGIDKSYSSIR